MITKLKEGLQGKINKQATKYLIEWFVVLNDTYVRSKQIASMPVPLLVESGEAVRLGEKIS